MNLPKNEYRISITSACNMKCVYCHNEGNRYNITLEKEAIRKLVENSYGLGLEKIRLTGGEPTIHYEFLDICKMLKEDYDLEVGINTNGIEIDKILYAINKGWIDRITVGIDYIDGFVSKQSPIGKSSKEILDNILKMKKTGVNTNMATVYTGDTENTFRLLEWALENGIRIKILELAKNEICKATREDYAYMREKVIKDYNLRKDYDQFGQMQGIKNDEVVVSFFHSHCRLRECDICKRIHLRVTAKGKLKQCLYYDDDDVNFMVGNIRDNVIHFLERPVDYHRQNDKPITRKRVEV